jgi:Sulfotransferase family
MQTSKIKVLYIAGFERSGSTLVNRVLGQLDDFVAWGELRDIWQHAILENRMCSCGEAFSNCSVWQQILRTAFGGVEQINAGQLFTLQRKTRARILLKHLGPLGVQTLQAHSGEYLSHLERLYGAIQTTTGCKVIVDSTKASWYGAALGMLPNLDLYVVHVTRDPRGVCYSLEQRKTSGEPECQWYNPLHAALSWNLKNMAVEALLNPSPERYIRLRFEDFVAQPHATLETILEFIGEPTLALPFSDRDAVEMKVDHIFTGSPSSRSATGTVKLRLDDRWKSGMKSQDQSLVAALTRPILHRYGYVV